MLAIKPLSQNLAALLLSAALSSGAHAQAPSHHFDAFGGKPGLVTLMDDFMVRLLDDPRTAPSFKPSNHARVKAQLVDQFCQVLGGPCVYRGADMKTAHRELDITTAQFNGLVELLQASMAAHKVPFGAQNELLSKLAFMHRDVVTVK